MLYIPVEWLELVLELLASVVQIAPLARDRNILLVWPALEWLARAIQIAPLALGRSIPLAWLVAVALGSLAPAIRTVLQARGSNILAVSALAAQHISAMTNKMLFRFIFVLVF